MLSRDDATVNIVRHIPDVTAINLAKGKIKHLQPLAYIVETDNRPFSVIMRHVFNRKNRAFCVTFFELCLNYRFEFESSDHLTITKSTNRWLSAFHGIRIVNPVSHFCFSLHVKNTLDSGLAYTMIILIYALNRFLFVLPVFNFFDGLVTKKHKNRNLKISQVT